MSNKLADFLYVVIIITVFIFQIEASNNRAVSHESVASGGTYGSGPRPTSSPDPIGLDENEAFWREVKAIFGGVLGFWGGVGAMGSIFLMLVLTQRYCCIDDEKDENE